MSYKDGPTSSGRLFFSYAALPPDFLWKFPFPLCCGFCQDPFPLEVLLAGVGVPIPLDIGCPIAGLLKPVWFFW
jgi:hypothetical protein